MTAHVSLPSSEAELVCLNILESSINELHIYSCGTFDKFPSFDFSKLKYLSSYNGHTDTFVNCTALEYLKFTAPPGESMLSSLLLKTSSLKELSIQGYSLHQLLSEPLSRNTPFPLQKCTIKDFMEYDTKDDLRLVDFLQSQSSTLMELEISCGLNTALMRVIFSLLKLEELNIYIKEHSEHIDWDRNAMYQLLPNHSIKNLRMTGQQNRTELTQIARDIIQNCHSVENFEFSGTLDDGTVQLLAANFKNLEFI